MNTDFQILPLYERPEFAEVCAAWEFAQWGCHNNKSLGEITDHYLHISQSSPERPFCWVAEMNDKPAGMITLTDEDHPDFTELMPWIVALYVHEKFRHKGLAGELLKTAEDKALKQNFSKVYLYTSRAKEIYLKYGWEILKPVRDPKGLSTQHVLMMKELKHEGTE